MIKQSEFGKFRMALISKISEQGDDHSKIDIVIECFIIAMEVYNWSTDDQLELLLATHNTYKVGYAKEKLMHEILAIKVNNGY